MLQAYVYVVLIAYAVVRELVLSCYIMVIGFPIVANEQCYHW